MAKLTKDQQLEMDALRMEVKLAKARCAQLERENADMIAELAPSSVEGAAYQSKLAFAESLLDEMAVELAGTIDDMRSARNALEIVCSSAASQAEVIGRAKDSERLKQDRLLALMKKARDLR